MAKFVVLPGVDRTQVGLALSVPPSWPLRPTPEKVASALELSLTKPLLTLRLVILNGPGLTCLACSLFLLLLVIHVGVTDLDSSLLSSSCSWLIISYWGD